MKKVIGNKVYDIETAEEFHAWDNGCTPTDFYYRLKVLFRTPNGRYFIYHKGGPKTDMVVKSGNKTYSGSSSIEAVDENEVFEFLQEHDGDELLLELFPEKVEEA